MANGPDTQNSLINKVVSFLNNNGYFVWRQENYGRFDSLDAFERLVKIVKVLRDNPHISDEQMEAAIKAALEKSWRKVPNNLKGVADVIGWNLTTGGWIAVEVKIGTDQIRPEQDIFLRRLKKSGGQVYLVRDFNSFAEGFWRLQNASAMSHSHL
jgi:hypothetical protein